MRRRLVLPVLQTAFHSCSRKSTYGLSSCHLELASGSLVDLKRAARFHHRRCMEQHKAMHSGSPQVKLSSALAACPFKHRQWGQHRALGRHHPPRATGWEWLILQWRLRAATRQAKALVPWAQCHQCRHQGWVQLPTVAQGIQRQCLQASQCGQESVCLRVRNRYQILPQEAPPAQEVLGQGAITAKTSSSYRRTTRLEALAQRHCSSVILDLPVGQCHRVQQPGSSLRRHNSRRRSRRALNLTNRLAEEWAHSLPLVHLPAEPQAHRLLLVQLPVGQQALPLNTGLACLAWQDPLRFRVDLAAQGVLGQAWQAPCRRSRHRLVPLGLLETLSWHLRHQPALRLHDDLAKGLWRAAWASRGAC